MSSIVNEKWMKSIHGDINNNVGDGDVVNVSIHDISSSSNDEFHKEWFWACLDIDDGIPSPFPWHLINA
jgi:hypothetical protein